MQTYLYTNIQQIFKRSKVTVKVDRIDYISRNTKEKKETQYFTESY